MEIKERSAILSFLKDLLKRTQDDDLAGLAAQLAYFFLLSLFPALIFLMTLLAYMPIDPNEVFTFLAQYAPPEGMALIHENLDRILENQNKGLLSIGIIGTIFTASNGINAIIMAFNRAYDIKETRSFIITRGISMILTVAMVFVIIFALVLPVFGQVIGHAIFDALGISDEFLAIWKIVRLLLSFLILFLAFSFLYKFAPNRPLHPREVMSGALFATFGWIAVSYLFAFYVDHFGNYSNTYGGLGGIIILMFWFYLTAWVILLGGEINALINCYRTGGKDSRNNVC